MYLVEFSWARMTVNDGSDSVTLPHKHWKHFKNLIDLLWERLPIIGSDSDRNQRATGIRKNTCTIVRSTYIDTWIHTYCYWHTDIHTSIHACMHASMHTCIHACIHTCVHAYMHTCIHASMSWSSNFEGVCAAYFWWFIGHGWNVGFGWYLYLNLHRQETPNSAGKGRLKFLIPSSQ